MSAGREAKLAHGRYHAKMVQMDRHTNLHRIGHASIVERRFSLSTARIVAAATTIAVSVTFALLEFNAKFNTKLDMLQFLHRSR